MLLETGNRSYSSNFAAHRGGLDRLDPGWCDEREDLLGGGGIDLGEGGVPDVLGGDRFVAEDSGDVGREFSAVENPDSLLREKLVGRFVPRYGNLLRVLPFFGLPRSLYAHPVVEVVAIVPREPVLALCKAFIVTELTSNEYAALVESNVPSESLLASCITVH